MQTTNRTEHPDSHLHYDRRSNVDELVGIYNLIVGGNMNLAPRVTLTGKDRQAFFWVDKNRKGHTTASGEFGNPFGSSKPEASPASPIGRR